MIIKETLVYNGTLLIIFKKELMGKFYALLILIFFVFQGCEPKTSALKHFRNSQINANTISYTKKKDLVVGNEVKGMIIATYVNKIGEKSKNLKNYEFIIGIYIVDNPKYAIKKNQLTLNTREALKIKPLSVDDKTIKGLTLKNNWAKYYKVSFKKKKKDSNINLIFNYPLLGKLQINFSK